MTLEDWIQNLYLDTPTKLKEATKDMVNVYKECLLKSSEEFIKAMIPLCKIIGETKEEEQRLLNMAKKIIMEIQKYENKA